MKRHLLFLLVSIYAVNILAQNGIEGKDVPFNGRIIGNDNIGIRKVKVSLVGNKKKTRTDRNGYFAFLNVPATDSLLVEGSRWSYKIPVNHKKSIKILLSQDGSLAGASEDEELVKIGVAHLHSIEGTGSDLTISGDDIRSQGLTDIYKIIQMRVAGASLIRSNDGHTGISLRKNPSLNDLGEAIYLIDGVRVNSLDQVVVWDIEKIEITRGSNIYGIEGANGVILITSRKK